MNDGFIFLKMFIYCGYTKDKQMPMIVCGQENMTFERLFVAMHSHGHLENKNSTYIYLRAHHPHFS